jgi:tight adherence protein B
MWVIALLVFVCVFGVAYLSLARLVAPRLAVTERLAYYTARGRGAALRARRRHDLSAAEQAAERLSIFRAFEDLLDQADVPIKPVEFALIMAFCTAGLTVLGQVARRVLGPAPFFPLLAGSVGFFAPLVWVRLRRSRRRAALNRQLPDALQAISSSLRAGYGFTQGMTVVATDLPAPISVEFARALREMNLGATVEDVLRGMARRIRGLDFDLAVSGILINRQVGGNLAELLDQLTATIRERVKMKNFIRVRTAQQRLSAMIIAGTPPVLLFIFLAGLPDYMSYLLYTRAGQAMLVLSVCMQLLGAYFLKRIVAIDV